MSLQLAGNPFAQFVFANMPTPSNPGPYMKFDHPDGSYASDGTNASYSRGVNNTDNRYSFRIDHQFNNRNNIFVRYTVIPVIGVRFFALDPSNPIGQIPTDAANAHDISFGYTRVLTQTIVNTLRYSVMRDNQQRTAPPVTLGIDYAAKYGLTPANVGHGFPSLGTFSTNGFNMTIQPGATNSSQIDQNFIVGDDVSWAHGNHLFQFGMDIRWIQSNQYDNSGSTGGKYSFSRPKACQVPSSVSHLPVHHFSDDRQVQDGESMHLLPYGQVYGLGKQGIAVVEDDLSVARSAMS